MRAHLFSSHLWVYSMQIFVKTLAGKAIAVEVEPTESVLSVKRTIHRKLGTAPELQCLAWIGRQLEDRLPLSHYNIQAESTLSLMLRAGGPSEGVPIMNVFVKLHTSNSTIVIDVQPSDLIVNVKQKIEAQSFIPQGDQRLLLRGKQLEDHLPVSHYEIVNQTTLQVVLRLGGPPRALDVLWSAIILTHDIIEDGTVNAERPVFTVTFRGDLDLRFITGSRGIENCGNNWMKNWTTAGPDYAFTVITVDEWVAVLELSAEFTSIPTVAAMKEHLNAVRYHYAQINDTYYGGQADSWQRYTASLPVRSSIEVDINSNIVRIRVLEGLKPNTKYAVVFLHSRDRWYEDLLLPFVTAGAGGTAAREAEQQGEGESQRSSVDAHQMDAVLCPIGHEVMTDPVMCADGHSYERVNIERWLATSNRSPKTNLPLPTKALIPNHALRAAIQAWKAHES